MLRIIKRRPKSIVHSVRLVFDSLTYKDIYVFKQDLIHYRVITSILGEPLQDQPVNTIWCQTEFGRCTLDKISTSVKVIILAKLAIKQHKRICFYAGDVGDNYLAELIRICKNVNNVYLYSKDGVLPQVSAYNISEVEVCECYSD